MRPVNGKKKRCYVYARLSTEDQHRRAEYSSLESQEKVCKAYIASQEPNGWKYVTTIKDISSGGNTDRPGLSKLLEHIKQNKVDVVVTTKMDRLTRSIRDFWNLYEIMQEHNCQYVCATQELNSTTAHGRFFINILMSFAEFELEKSGKEPVPRCYLKPKRACGMVDEPHSAMNDIRIGRVC